MLQGGVIAFNRGVREGVTVKITFEQTGGKWRGKCCASGERAFKGAGGPGAEALGWEYAQRVWEQKGQVRRPSGRSREEAGMAGTQQVLRGEVSEEQRALRVL